MSEPPLYLAALAAGSLSGNPVLQGPPLLHSVTNGLLFVMADGEKDWSRAMVMGKNRHYEHHAGLSHRSAPSVQIPVATGMRRRIRCASCRKAIIVFGSEPWFAATPADRFALTDCKNPSRRIRHGICVVGGVDYDGGAECERS